MYSLLLGLQLFHVLLLLLHDWMPLGRLNDLRALREHIPSRELLRTTLLLTFPFALSLALTVHYRHLGLPPWAILCDLLAYGLMVAMQWRLWWSPYFYGTTQERVIFYKKLFGHTHTFLPRRNGIRPNTLNTLMHLLTVGTLLVLLLVGHRSGLL
jgi:hypothetical protein